jgi:Tfp pilus assembly protein PilE
MTMRLPRMTIRRWMVAVALIAVLSAIGVELWRRSLAYSRLADLYFGRAAIWSDTKKIERDMALSERYRRAARSPWLPVEPDPPEPR